MQQDSIINKGYILDLPVTGEFNWIKQIFTKNGLYLPRIGCRHFTHVIQLEHTDEEVILFSSKFMEQDYNPEEIKPEELKELK
jgi:adenylate/nucleoside-diphosphate kinase